ncbi:MAG: hypothetical protein EP330_14215 [Deltaproteobacteria bacterium]|nr:MAG: hypothetical protein EP330_14215 [Deltaproteobacteria bacterium]
MSALLLTALALANPTLNDPDRPYAVELTAELGFLAPMSHKLQFGSDGTLFDYVKDGGQDNLFPSARASAALHWRRQVFTAVYQPLDLRSTVVTDQDLRVDDLTFTAGTPMNLRYGFSYWRLSWGHRVLDRDAAEITVGLGLQIRNATIGFTSVDGSQSEFNRDIGPVPLLEFEYRRRFDDGFFFETEVDGFYAPIKYLNGRDVDVIGAIADIQLRAGLDLADPVEAYLGLRYIGGGGEGTGTPDGTGDGFVRNWLHFAALTIGGRVR